MYHNLKAFQVKFNLKSVKGKKTPYLDNDVVMNAQKDYLNTRIELGNNDFRDQRILVRIAMLPKSGKNTRGCHILWKKFVP